MLQGSIIRCIREYSRDNIHLHDFPFHARMQQLHERFLLTADVPIRMSHLVDQLVVDLHDQMRVAYSRGVQVCVCGGWGGGGRHERGLGGEG